MWGRGVVIGCRLSQCGGEVWRLGVGCLNVGVRCGDWV